MFGLLAKLALGGLMRVGVSEGAAGAFVVGRWFKPLALLVLLPGLWLAGKAILALHDRQLIKVAYAQCVSEHKLAAAEMRAGMLHRAVQQLTRTIQQRESEIDLERRQSAKLEADLQEARNASKNPSRVCVEPGDPWLQPGGKRPAS